MPSINGKRKRKAHHKVRTGCVNCRQRRLKCDEAKPSCQRCVQAQLECKGYTPPKAWIFELNSGPKERALGDEETTTTTITTTTTVTSSTASTTYRRRQLPKPTNLLGVSSFTSTSFRNSYDPSEQPRVSQLFEYIMQIYGPTFIWRIHTDEQERRVFAPKFVHWCMRETALLEGLFAVATLIYPITTSSITMSGHHASQHYTRALRSLQKRLSAPSAVQDDTVFWTIMSLILFSHDSEDWRSFETHLGGLNRIVTVRGGLDTMRDQCSRVFIHCRWAESCYQQHCSSFYRRPSYQPTEDCDTETQSPATCANFTLPGGILEMVNRNLLGHDVIQLAQRITEWFSFAESSDMNQTDIPRITLCNDLNEIIENGTLDWPELILCIGMLVVIVCHPPFLVEYYPVPLSRHVEKALKMPSEMIDNSWSLWTALMTASLPVPFGISASDRWGLLERQIEFDIETTSWEEASEKSTGFFSPKILREQWKQCWHIARMKSEWRGLCEEISGKREVHPVVVNL